MPALATLDDKFNVPVSRLGSAPEAYNYVYGVVQADNLRAQYRTHIDGLIGGNAPYPKTKRDRTNLNFRQATAIVSQFKIPFYDLLSEVPLLFEIETLYGNSEERADWSQIISEEFHRLLTSWEDWEDTMQQVIAQMITHNIGHLYWPDALDWRPQPARVSEILVADQSSNRLSKLEAVVIRKGYLATELMRYIDNERVARQVGWTPKEVKLAVKESYRGGNNQQDMTSQWEYFQQKRRNGDLYFGQYECERVWTAHVLAREFNGNISNQILRTSKQTSEFLYRNPHEFDSMSEAICPFFYDIGDGTWHSGSGVGKEIYPYCQIFNMLRCREVDAAMIAASVLVQAKDANSAKVMQMMTLDNLKIIPNDVTFIEHAIGQNIQATVDVRRDMEQGMMQNIGGLMRTPGQPDPRKGQQQALIEMQQSASVGKGKINSFYTYLDREGRTIFKKVVNPKLQARHPGGKEALEFRQRCEKRGVPAQALQEIDFIKAYRSAGAGSSVNAIMALESIKDMAPSFNEPGRMAYMRILVSRLLGTRTADMLVGEIKTAEKKTDQDWMASIENRELRQGADGRTFFSETQNHVIHARAHNQDAAAHLAEVEQTASQQELAIEDLQPLHVHLEASGPHTFDHLQRLKGDKLRAGDYQKLYKDWMQLAHMADQVKKNLEQMMQARAQAQQQQAAQQPNPDLLKLLATLKGQPESVRAQVETIVGTPRAPGDLSVDAQNLKIKEANTQLKAAKQRQQGVVTDIQTAQSIQKHGREMAEPLNGNGQ